MQPLDINGNPLILYNYYNCGIKLQYIGISYKCQNIMRFRRFTNNKWQIIYRQINTTPHPMESEYHTDDEDDEDDDDWFGEPGNEPGLAAAVEPEPELEPATAVDEDE